MTPPFTRLDYRRRNARYAGETWRVEEGQAYGLFDQDSNILTLSEPTPGYVGVNPLTPAQIVRWRSLVGSAVARWRGREYLLEMELYIRFGALPYGASRNHTTGVSEAGISCYHARPDYLTGCFHVDGPGLLGAAILAAFGVYGHVCLLLAGTLAGVGSDGEPLLRPARIVARLQWDDGWSGFTIQD